MGYVDFFQSEEFGQFQEKIPYRGKTWLLKVQDHKSLKATCLVIRNQIRLGRCYFWIPYGPVFLDKEHTASSLHRIFGDLEKLAKEERAIFTRIEPARDISKFLEQKEFQGFNLKKTKKTFGQKHTLVLDLSKSEHELLAEMHEKGRYNLNVARRHRVTIQRFDDLRAVGAKFAFSEFYKLLSKTAEHQKFRQHQSEFYETLLDFLGSKKMASLFVAQFEGKIVGGIIIIWYGDTATYYYGASSYEDRSLMAPYLLHFEALLEAKKRGFQFYDFFGIAPEGEENHPLRGVSEFKKKFGGFEVHFGEAYDLVHKPLWYFLYNKH